MNWGRLEHELNYLEISEMKALKAGVQGAPTLNVTGGLPPPLGSLAKLEIAPEIVRTLPAEFAKRHCLLPSAVRNGTPPKIAATRGHG